MRNSSRIVKFLILYLFFQFVLVSYRLFPTIQSFTPFWFFFPLGEILLIVLLLLPGRLQKLRYLIALFFTGTLLLYNLGEIFYRFFYMVNFHFLKDIPLIPGLFVMLIPEGLLPPSIIRILSVIFTLCLLVSLAWLILIPLRKTLNKNPAPSPFYMFFVAMSLALGLIFFFPEKSPLIQIVKDVSVPKSSLMLSAKDMEPQDLIENLQAVEAVDSLVTLDSVENLDSMKVFESVAPESNWTFPGIKDSDVHIIVVESYGSTLFQRSEYIEVIETLYDRLNFLLQEDGWAARTGFVRSPAFGGRSWLADSTILSGIQMVNQQMFDQSVEEGSPAELLKMMGDAGYYRHYVAPGTTDASDQWKAAYPFENYMLRPDFDYEGPNITFGRMSDQFAFHVFGKGLLDDRKDFAFYILVSSHVPFERIPVFKADWDFSRNGREYNDGYLKYFENNWLYGNELAEGYLEGISYSLETTIRYITEILSDNEFVVVIGDHQPRKPVSGPEAGYPVPFHIIAPTNNNLIFPDSWDLSSDLHPPQLPYDDDVIPEMADITALIETLLAGDKASAAPAFISSQPNEPAVQG